MAIASSAIIILLRRVPGKEGFSMDSISISSAHGFVYGSLHDALEPRCASWQGLGRDLGDDHGGTQSKSASLILHFSRGQHHEQGFIAMEPFSRHIPSFILPTEGTALRRSQTISYVSLCDMFKFILSTLDGERHLRLTTRVIARTPSSIMDRKYKRSG